MRARSAWQPSKVFAFPNAAQHLYAAAEAIGRSVFLLTPSRGPLRQARHKHDFVAVIVMTMSLSWLNEWPTRKPKASGNNNNVHTLFDAAVRKQLQGAIGIGPAAHSLSIGRDRYSQGRKPHARISRQESERAGSAAGSCARPL